MEAFLNLTNAAREFIAERLETIERNEFNDYTTEDKESAEREHDLIESEITMLATLLVAARAMARMKHPSVERQLRHREYDYEADRVADLVRAIEAIGDDADHNKDSD